MDDEIRTRLDRGSPQEAFDLLLAAYRDRVFRLCWAMLGDPAAAEETAQEAFLRIWKGLPGFRWQAALSTWIYAIARNACITALRARAARSALSLADPAVCAAAEAPRSRPPERGFPDVMAAVAALPEKQRQALLLYHMEEKSYQEVAAMLDLPMGTVKTYLHGARRELALALAGSKITPGGR